MADGLTNVFRNLLNFNRLRINGLDQLVLKDVAKRGESVG